MEGYLNLRIQPWLRRLITRLIAIVPAFIVIHLFGEESTGKLLVLSRVILSLQLGFAVIPLIHFTSDKNKMGSFAIKLWAKICAWATAIIIVSLNVKLVIDTIVDWARTSNNLFLIYFIVIPLALASGGLLLYVTFSPFLKKSIPSAEKTPHSGTPILGIPSHFLVPTSGKFTRIAIAVDFSFADSLAVREALQQGGGVAEYIFIHVVETAGALMMREDIDDYETVSDSANLNSYIEQLKLIGVSSSMKLGYGNPKRSIPDLVLQCGADLLVMGAHGHGALRDLVYGTTIDSVRHKVKIPVVIVKK